MCEKRGRRDMRHPSLFLGAGAKVKIIQAAWFGQDEEKAACLVLSGGERVATIEID